MTLLALTGVPGTGKTTVAKHLAPHVPVHDANQLAHAVDAIDGYDEARDADIVDEQRFSERAREELPDETLVLEGALSHHVDADAVVLLRCHPDELRARLAHRDWPPEKIDENVMAETLDALVHEIDAPRAWEIDTTGTDPERVAQLVLGLLDETEPGDEVDPLGTADWTDTLTGGPPG